MGDLFEEPPITLGEAMDGTLARVRSTRDISPKTAEYNARSAKVWQPLHGTRLPMLRRTMVEDLIQKRAETNPRSAKNELEFLKRVLHDAKGRGQRVDEAIFEIPPVRHRPRRGRGLTVTELEELASWFPEHSKRLVLVAGQVGARQNVWFNLTDDMLDLDAGTMSIPAWLAKRRRDHRVYLTQLETALLSKQLTIRPAGTSLVFPSPTGQLWKASGFYERVWAPSIAAAITNDPATAAGRSSVYDGFTFHMLRHTAASLMAASGMAPAAAAERLEHSDGGALFHKVYRHLYEGEKRVQAQRLEIHVLAELDKNGTAAPLVGMDANGDAAPRDGRYWARTSDPQLVELVLSQLS